MREEGGRTYDVAVPPAVAEVGVGIVVWVLSFVLAVLVVPHVFGRPERREGGG